MKTALRPLLLILSLFSFSAVQAAPIYFPLWEEGDNELVAEEMMFFNGDLTLTVSAWTGSFNSEGEQLESWTKVQGNDLGVYRDDKGLGVISSLDDGNDLDGGSSGNFANDPDEGLLFVFSRSVNLFDFFVGDLDGSDDFNISMVSFTSPANIELSGSIIDIFGPPFEEEFAFDFSQEGFYSSAFMLWVDGGSDDIEVLGVAITSVASPATLTLILLGAFGVFYSSKRRH